MPRLMWNSGKEPLGRAIPKPKRRGNVHHLNLSTSLAEIWWPQGRPESVTDGVLQNLDPSSIIDLLACHELPKRHQQIFQLLMAGNQFDQIDWALSLEQGEARRVVERYRAKII